MSDQVSELRKIWTELGKNERTLLLNIADRLLAGQKQYGEVFPGKKRWDREALEEAMDGTVYMALLLTEFVTKEEASE